MKTYIASLLSIVLVLHSSKGNPLQDSKITEIVSSAVPDYNIAGGDYGWSGGVKGNADMNNQLFDSNTAFLILKLNPEKKPLTAKKIAEKINGYIIKNFNFPTTTPSSTWMKKQPKGTTEETFGQTFLKTYPKNNDAKAQAMYLTIQIVKLANSEFAVTATYVNREQ